MGELTMQKPIAIPKTAAEHQPLDTRAGELVGCCENSAEAAKLEAIAHALDTFDAKAAAASTPAMMLAKKPTSDGLSLAVELFG